MCVCLSSFVSSPEWYKLEPIRRHNINVSSGEPRQRSIASSALTVTSNTRSHASLNMVLLITGWAGPQTARLRVPPPPLSLCLEARGVCVCAGVCSPWSLFSAAYQGRFVRLS